MDWKSNKHYNKIKSGGCSINGKIYSLDKIKNIVTLIAIQHGIKKVYIFGSYARGSATKKSDVDLCVDASNLRGLFELDGLYADFEEALDKELSLIMLRAVEYDSNSCFCKKVQKELKLLYELM